MHAEKKDEEVTYVIEVRLDEAEVRRLRTQLKAKDNDLEPTELVKKILACCVPEEV